MSAPRLRLGRRIVASISTAALASFAILGASSAAHAAPGNVNFDEKGSITVHKHAEPGTGEPATGDVQDVESAALEGVEFSLHRVQSIDLSEPSDWDQLAGLAATNYDPAELPEAGSGQTGADGSVTFADLNVGVYLVTEGEDHGDNNIVRSAEPFLVSIPTLVDNKWLYDVHVYPKNSVANVDITTELDATADDAAYGAGDPIQWNVSATAPGLGPEDTLGAYSFEIPIDERLEFQSIANVTYANEQWTAGEEYTVEESEDGQTVTVTLEVTEAGREVIEANSAQELTYEIHTIVDATAEDIGNGIIEQTVTQSTDINEISHETTSEPATTYWRNFEIHKVDGSGQGLEGAEYRVFRSAEDAENLTNPVTIHGDTRFVTGADGTVVIGPLNAGADNSRPYWFVETQAPAGYVLDDTVRDVTITVDGTEQIHEIGSTAQDSFDLPLTGAAGTGIFLLVGLALLTLGGGLYVRNRRAAKA